MVTLHWGLNTNLDYKCNKEMIIQQWKSLLTITVSLPCPNKLRSLSRSEGAHNIATTEMLISPILANFPGVMQLQCSAPEGREQTTLLWVASGTECNVYPHRYRCICAGKLVRTGLYLASTGTGDWKAHVCHLESHCRKIGKKFNQ